MEARSLILQADEIARRKGLNQSKWSKSAGYANNGQTVSRILSKGDCRVSTFLALVNALGCRIEIKEVQEDGEVEG